MGKLLAWLLAAGKLGKVLTTGGTMLLSMAAYSLVFVKNAIWGDPHADPRYYQVVTEQRINYAAMYLLLTAFLAVMSYQLHATVEAAR